MLSTFFWLVFLSLFFEWWSPGDDGFSASSSVVGRVTKILLWALTGQVNFRSSISPEVGPVIPASCGYSENKLEDTRDARFADIILVTGKIQGNLRSTTQEEKWLKVVPFSLAEGQTRGICVGSTGPEAELGRVGRAQDASEQEEGWAQLSVWRAESCRQAQPTGRTGAFKIFF